ncbi:predicted protein [Streptomyces viridosporus ATCC 14672]|uniref:Predicted protein n=1 Tax=Streptomyces viridosporus (strain ATCC 14672 / DSM 40746 / JCM 4963 / KCTC 9882 / NRRL B-12104 / FH 1290) TaxID=566461 RepID=D6A5L8_STRV1|nr:predicted protein [Streptomyces viridosporus ATCC 14672]
MSSPCALSVKFQTAFELAFEQVDGRVGARPAG